MANGEDQLGEPIEDLRELEQETSPQFLNVVRNKIHRRTAASQMISFSWELPKTVLMELGNLLAAVMKAFVQPRRE